ncbi:MAG: TRAP transporter substrate-binding protein [Deltaproteobacteria bacterium]|nr:TRAP transporter substrate-binding protein [Candidatus Anaeroferrophillus wilburensis]MBN2888727.1 TRAP transporter substrate-binding protein [Deltaproteobacteria bacterium]
MVRRWCKIVTLVALAVLIMIPSAWGAKANPLAKWKSDVDMSQAKYVMKVSNVSHPVIEGVGVGYRIRDSLWQRSNGQIALQYYPLCQLGGEVEVLNMLQTGTVQGMLCSSVAVTNLAPRMGIVNLPFLINSFDKLESFVNNKELFDHFLDGMSHQGVMGVDITGYGNYGWATTIPVQSIDDAKKVKFRIAEAAVNKSLYEVWGFHPVVMPWPDVPISLKQGVITGLDHTPMVCNITKKFEICKNFTQINYAQGLFIHLINKAWFDALPADLQKTVLDVFHEESAKTRELTRAQEATEIAKAKESGVSFYQLSDDEHEKLRVLGDKVHKEWANQIGIDYLKKVQDFVGYKRILDY